MRREIIAATLFTVLTQGLAFAKLWVVAQIFGVGAEYDGYNLSLVVPTWLSGVLAALIQTGFFPVRARLSAEQGEAAAQEYDRAVLTVILVVGALSTLLLWASHPLWLNYVVSGASPQTWAAVEMVVPFAVGLVLLNVTSDTLGYLLAIRRRYWIAAAAPAANALLATVLLLAWPEGRLLNLALGTVLGLAVQLAIIGLAAAYYGSVWPASWSVLAHYGPTLRKTALLSTWIIPGVMFSNALTTLPPVLLTDYGEGAVSAFSYAYRLHSSAVQLLIIAISPVILSHLSTLVARGDMAQLRSLLRRAAYAAITIGALALGVVLLWGGDVLCWLFGGQFQATAAQRIKLHWAWLTAGLSFALLGTVYAKLWQAQQRPRFISLLAGSSLLVFSLVTQGLASLAGEYAIAIALGCASLFVVLCGTYDTTALFRRAAVPTRTIYSK